MIGLASLWANIRFSILFLFFISTIFYFVLNFIDNATFHSLPQSLQKKLRYGIDFNGGQQIIIQANLSEIQQSLLEQIFLSLQDTKKICKFTVKIAQQPEKIVVSFPNTEALTFFLKNVNIVILTIMKTTITDKIISFTISEHALEEYCKKAMEDLKIIITNRLNAHKFEDVSVRIYGKDVLLIQVAYQDNMQSIPNIIGKVARLSLHTSISKKISRIKPIYIHNMNIVCQDHKQTNLYYTLDKRTILNNENIVMTQVISVKIANSFLNSLYHIKSEDDVFGLSIKLNNIGANKLLKILTKGVSHNILIVLDNRVIGTVFIQNQTISDNVCTLYSHLTKEEAEHLSILLNNRALPTTIKIIDVAPIPSHLQIIRHLPIYLTITILLFFIILIIMYSYFGIAIFAITTAIIVMTFGSLSMMNNIINIHSMISIIFVFLMASSFGIYFTIQIKKIVFLRYQKTITNANTEHKMFQISSKYHALNIYNITHIDSNKITDHVLHEFLYLVTDITLGLFICFGFLYYITSKNIIYFIETLLFGLISIMVIFDLFVIRITKLYIKFLDKKFYS